MTSETVITKDSKGLGFFEKYLTLWIFLCIIGGIMLGKIAPQAARYLDGLAVYSNGAPVISIPIAICLFFMMFPIMVKIDFAEVIKAGKSVKPVLLTLIVNWAIKPFTMYAIALLFLGVLFRGLIGIEAVDLVKLPFGLDLPVGAHHGAGTVVMSNGVKMLELPLWRSFFAGAILLGIAPCTAMVLVWGFLARGNGGHTLVMVAINSLSMLLLYGPLGGFLLGVGKLPVPWQALFLSIAVYVALPLAAGYLTRKWIVGSMGIAWFNEKFLQFLSPITIMALLITLILLFSFKGETIISRPLLILWIAIPLFIQMAFLANGKFWVNNHAHILKPRYGNIRYFVHLLELLDYSLYVTGAAQPKLTKENLGRYKIIVPPEEEQNVIAEYLDVKVQEFEKLEENIKDQISTLQQYRKSLIHECVTGKRRITDADVRGLI